MATATFSSLPAEIHVSIAEDCETKDLVNLCRTSRLMNERCRHIIYRHVNLLSDPYKQGHSDFLAPLFDRQQQFIETLLSHPGHGKYVQFLKGTISIPSFGGGNFLGEDIAPVEEWWRAIQSLTHIRSVHIASRDGFENSMVVPVKQFPNDLLRFTTSVRLIGRMQYGLAKSILNAVNPAALEHLCLDMVQDHMMSRPQGGNIPGNSGEDGRIIADGLMSGLLTTLTGRCTALRILILRRFGTHGDISRRLRYPYAWHTAADEAAYVEWASFVRSIQGTVENFIFEQADKLPPYYWSIHNRTIPTIRAMDERFRRLLFPAIVLGNWPCLTNIELRGVGGWNNQGEQAEMRTELRALLGQDANIVVEAEAQNPQENPQDIQEPFFWD